MSEWEKRRVGRTDLHVTSLGLGTATMGGSRIPMTMDERRQAGQDAAWDAGVRYVDTAPFYGVGAAERARRRCAARQVRATNGCCPPRSADCCARMTAGTPDDDGRSRRCRSTVDLRLLVRRHHAFGGGQLSAPRPGQDRHPVCARHRRLPARRGNQRGAHERAARQRLSGAGRTAPHRRGAAPSASA